METPISDIEIIEADEVLELRKNSLRPAIIAAVRAGARGEKLLNDGELAQALDIFGISTVDLRRLITDYRNAEAEGYFEADYDRESKKLAGEIVKLSEKIQKAESRVWAMKNQRSMMIGDSRGRRSNKAGYSRKLNIECCRGIISDAN